MTSLLRYQEPPPNPKPLSTSHVWGVTTLYVVVKAAGNTAPPTLSESELADVRWEPGPGRESDPRAESRPEVAGSAMARNVCGESAHPLCHSPLVTSLGNPSAPAVALVGYGQNVAFPSPTTRPPISTVQLTCAV